MMRKGIIFNIQRFSIHDGPGIRTAVFMKGCPLKCQWCSNPESQTRENQLMIRSSKCVGCGNCVGICPEEVISLEEDDGGGVETNWEKCQQCLACVEACLYGARTVVGDSVTVDEVMKEVNSDSVFYKNSGGGVTVSGGEPLQQSAFVVELLKECKSQGIHTAVETSGFASKATMASVAEHTDLFLFDIKHLDLKQHILYTGVSNENILENIQVAAKTTETWIRIPLISGVNDSPEHIRQVVFFARQLDIKKISLLPYHEGGLSKSNQLGENYLIPEAKPPSDHHLSILSDIVSNKGLEATVGH